MNLYNTLTKKVEKFIPNNKNFVNMYTCGPTVYHYAHIGNLRTYIMEDILEKTLIYLGYKVNRVMNITDVGHLTSDADLGDDKMVKGAIREKKTVLEIADFYTKAFKEDCLKLNIRWPDTVIPATSCIDKYIEMINILIDKNYAYVSGNNVYFDTSKLKEYYVLTNHDKEELKEGVREDVEVDNNKKNKTDFVLWFTKSKFQDQELKWDSPWGLGYPGWHIECSGISLKYLGYHLDIHCGGVDNIFPHHTNEIAQTESCIGHKWCNYWFHVEHLNDKIGKMSKSKGNFLTIKTLENNNIPPLGYRYFCLQSHYRKPLEFSFPSLEGATNSYLKLKSKIKNLDHTKDRLDDNIIKSYQEKFRKALEDDLNTATALTILYDVLKDNKLNDYSKIYLIKDFDKVLSLDLINVKNDNIADDFKEYIEKKLLERNIAKNNKDYILADSIREELLNKGIIIKDTKDGTLYEMR